METSKPTMEIEPLFITQLCAKEVPSLAEAQVLELISLFLFMGRLRNSECLGLVV